MAIFPAVANDIEAMQEVINQFPQELIKALGLLTLDLSTVLGFYGYIFLYIHLIGAVYAMKAGTSVLSEEIRAKTTDFLVAKPVTRNMIVTAKLIGIITYIIFQNLIFALGSLTIVNMFSEKGFDLTTFLLIDLSLFFVQLFFIGLGMLIAVMIKKIKTVLPITLGIVFGFFVIHLLNQSLADEKLSYLTPFAYFDVTKIITNGNYDLKFLVIDMVIFGIFTLCTYIIFHKRDLPTV